MGLIGPGLLVLVVGPSGAGKDAVIRETRKRLVGDPSFVFPRRVVTRAANAAEDHVTVAPHEFDELVRRHSFAIHWQAHGLQYGIPVEIDASLRAGHSVVFNASRYLATVVRARYANAAVVLVDAPFAQRAERLAARDRETAHDIAARLERVVSDPNAPQPDLVICNDGALDRAVDILSRWLQTRLATLPAALPT